MNTMTLATFLLFCFCSYNIVAQPVFIEQDVAELSAFDATVTTIKDKLSSHPLWEERYLPQEANTLDAWFRPSICKQHSGCLRENKICKKCIDSDSVPCDAVCSFPYDCSATRPTNVCVETLKDMECNQTSQCQGVFLDGPMYCSLADNGLCKPNITGLLPNDKCTDDKQCRSIWCVDDKCRAADEGVYCTSTQDCQPELDCDLTAQRCVKRVQDGDPPSSGPSCYDLENVVANNVPTCKDRRRVCENNTNGVWQCLEVFTQGLNYKCKNSEVCQPGMACINATCQYPDLTNEGRACSAANASLCGVGLECKCDRLLGHSVCMSTANFCYYQWRGFWNCVSPQKHNCHPLSDPHGDNSCVRAHCWSEYKTVLGCMLYGHACTTFSAATRETGFLFSFLSFAFSLLS